MLFTKPAFIDARWTIAIRLC